jgi:acetyl-CoA carboxylase alpha subunit
MASVATPEATAAVLVREHEKALRQMSHLILNVDEVGKSDVVM